MKNRKRNIQNGPYMQQTSHNHYHYEKGDVSNNHVEHGFYLAAIKDIRDYFERFLAGQHIYHNQHLLQQQEYLEMQLKSWQELLVAIRMEKTDTSMSKVN